MPTGPETPGRRRIVTCRYLRQNGEQCTGEAVNDEAEILICTKHLARALRVVTSRRAMPGLRDQAG